MGSESSFSIETSETVNGIYRNIWNANCHYIIATRLKHVNSELSGRSNGYSFENNAKKELQSPSANLTEEKHCTEVRWAHQSPATQYGIDFIYTTYYSIICFKEKKWFQIGIKENYSYGHEVKWSVLHIFKSIFNECDFFGQAEQRLRRCTYWVQIYNISNNQWSSETNV